MDHTRRQLTKIAREVSKFTVRTMRAERTGPQAEQPPESVSEHET